MLRNNTTYFNMQFNEFDKNWHRFSEELRRGDVPAYPERKNVYGKEKFLTLIVRLEETMLERIYKVCKVLSSFDSDHYFYPTQNIHMTVLDCTSFVPDRHSFSTENITPILEICNSVINRQSSFKIRGKGLNLFPTTVFVQLFNQDYTLWQLRYNLHEILVKSLGKNNYESLIPPPFLSYANVVRFTHRNELEFINEVQKFRVEDFSSMVVKQIELVVTDKVLSTQNTVTLGKIEINE